MTPARAAYVAAVTARVIEHIRASAPADGVYLTEAPSLTVRRPCGRGHVQVAGTKECSGCRWLNNQKRRKEGRAC